jgi:CubicO group peptidase (beta-lactamase class C family)
MTTLTPSRPQPSSSAVVDLEQAELEARAHQILNRHPAMGLGLEVVRDGSVASSAHGLADVASGRPISDDTVFRIGSITKTVTAVAIMQLWERGLVDLDAPANEHLRAYPLISNGFRPATVRHLLTHTAGIPDALHFADLLHFSWGPFEGRPPVASVPFGEQLPSLAHHYRGGLRQVAEPGVDFAYSNPGFATLGQIVEDVSRLPLDRYLRERIFEPLGMTDTDLVRSERLASRLATGYVLESTGARPVPDRDWIGAGAGGLYSTARDLARYAAALLGGGTNDHGSVLGPATLATMFDHHHRPHPRLPGMGLGFFRTDFAGHHVVSHGGILPGFNTELIVAPDDGFAVIGLTNGSSGAMAWLPSELEELMRHLLGVPGDAVRSDVPHHPEVWRQLCGRYRLPRVGDLRGRLGMGVGVEVFVRSGRLMVRILTPVPALYRGLPLHPEDEADRYLFRLDLSTLGMGMVRLGFVVRSGVATVIHTDLGGQPISLYRVTPRRWRAARQSKGIQT